MGNERKMFEEKFDGTIKEVLVLTEGERVHQKVAKKKIGEHV